MKVVPCAKTSPPLEPGPGERIIFCLDYLRILVLFIFIYVFIYFLNKDPLGTKMTIRTLCEWVCNSVCAPSEHTAAKLKLNL